MNLFPYEPTLNLLPFDGIANYYGPILASCEAQDYLEALLTTVPWRNDEAVICGKRIVTARKVAWYGDSSFSYTYSGTTKIALPWTKELRTLKSRVEENYVQCGIDEGQAREVSVLIRELADTVPVAICSGESRQCWRTRIARQASV